MRNRVILHRSFARSAKKLAKRYHSFTCDLTELIRELKVDPTLGVSLGGNLRKIRLSIKSKGKGKSGGARVITYLVVVEETIYLLAVYDKSDMENIPDEDLKALVDELKKEMR
ncbi:MAG TPA: type II toxin-antitoxin system RelE/ParE family toxin [Pyrinomonadaceae bacterium]|nr:type II toxin-antitoxin system RelE/ParE family toxin [Pyrinomonadaceae bacterium]